MSLAEEAFKASQAMWEIALEGARENLSDDRMSGNQIAIKRAEENCINVEIACMYSKAAVQTVKLKNNFGTKWNETSPCDNCGKSPCLDGQFVRKAGQGFRVLEVKSGQVGIVKTKSKKGVMKIKWDCGKLNIQHGYDVYDPAAGQFLLKYCCREDNRLDINEEKEGEEDSTNLTILAKKNQQIIDVTSAADDDNEKRLTSDDQNVGTNSFSISEDSLPDTASGGSMIKYDKEFLINMRNCPIALTLPAQLLINMYNNYIPHYVFRLRPLYEDPEKPSHSDDEKQCPARVGVPDTDVTRTKEGESGERETPPLNVNGVTIFS